MMLLLPLAILLARVSSQQYKLGPVGTGTCPAGFAKIDDRDKCVAAAESDDIKLEYDSHYEKTDGVCSKCGGCNDKAKFSTWGHDAEWICENKCVTTPTCDPVDDCHGRGSCIDGETGECTIGDPINRGASCGSSDSMCDGSGNCLELVLGVEGIKACPEDYSPIENEADCEYASDVLGYEYDATFNKEPEAGDPSVCTLCGGCPKEPKPTKFGKNGILAKWVCIKDDARRELTNRLVKQLEF